MLAQLKARDALDDPASLLEIVFAPIAEIVDSTGRHTYAAFQLGMREFDRDGRIRTSADDLAPFSKYVVELLRQSLAHLTSPLFYQWLLSATLVFLDMIVRIDDKTARLPEDEMVREALSLVTAMMTAPVTKGRRSAR